jgi:N,N'-diacetyllegionaminate synthase
MSVKIIAEIAQGYEGKPEQARLLAKAGVAAGADAIKFQCVYADDISVPSYKHYSFFKTLEMPVSVWAELSKIVHDAGKEFILNVGGQKSLQMALDVSADAVKFHATSFFCDDLIKFAKENFEKIYISLGGISVSEIQSFIKRHNISPNEQFSFTYGFQSSPTPLEKNNLNKLKSFKSIFPGFSFGFEDHTDATINARFVVPLMALPMGVSHIEKHLTLDSLLNLEDAESALSVSDFKLFTESVREIEQIFGSDDLSLTDVEQDYRRRVLKVAVADKHIIKGQVITENDITLKRVETPKDHGYLRKEELIGKTLNQDITQHAQILQSMID